jgi:hypothetical protein
MAIIKKTKQNYKTNSKTKTNSSSRKHFNKSRKCGSKTRKVRGGGGGNKKGRFGRAVSWVRRHMPGNQAQKRQKEYVAKRWNSYQKSPKRQEEQKVVNTLVRTYMPTSISTQSPKAKTNTKTNLDNFAARLKATSPNPGGNQSFVMY